MEAAVRQADGSSFFQSAESLEKELKQIPGLVAAYEKQADRLAKELQGSEQGAQEAQPDLEETSWGMVQEEMRGYRSYLDEDGARRQEVKRQKRRLTEMKRWLQKQSGKERRYRIISMIGSLTMRTMSWTRKRCGRRF